MAKGENASTKIRTANSRLIICYSSARTLLLLRCRNCFIEQRVHCRFPAGAVARANDPVPHSALAIYQISCRQLCLGVAASGHYGIFESNHLLLVVLNSCCRVVERRPHHFQPAAAEITLHGVEYWYLFAARNAIRGSKIKKHHIAAQLTEGERLAAKRL